MNNVANKSVEITVSANADADNCLVDAAAAYIAEHSDLKGYDLAPRWTDDERETVTLTVPAWAADYVTVEEMPDHHRGSHRAAGNWGVYPRNGATRREVSREEADEIVAADSDNYAHIVDD